MGYFEPPAWVPKLIGELAVFTLLGLLMSVANDSPYY